MGLKVYSHKDIESKWTEIWASNNLYVTPEIKPGDKKKYILDAFAYPSGSGLHVGHTKGYIATDIIARYERMLGYKVLYPFGWDSFGLPAENFAIKNGLHPRISTEQAIGNFVTQLKKLGFSNDWNDEIASHRSDYYKWTQWFFSFLYKKGLAYKKEALVNWDPVDQTVLANEQVLADGTGERSGAKVEQKMMSQWFFKITDYIEDKVLEDGRVRKGLISGLDDLDWPESTKQMQRNWIGRSEGINITYKIAEEDSEIVVYTTRPDTNFGATFIVVAPDSQWVKNNFVHFKYKENCQEYINKTKLKSQLDRLSEGKIKTGEFTGLHAVNALNGRKLPIYLSDFVLSTVGTGAVIGVPGHDVRDFDFAQTKNLPIIRVVVGSNGDTSEINKREQVQESEGTMINSQFLDGLPIMEAKEKIKDFIEEKGFGKRVINYKLRDWLVSRQRYWGAPIPIYYKHARPQFYKVLLLTTNQGKIRHIKSLLEHVDLEIFTLSDLDYKITEPEETGSNVTEIAKNKALYYWNQLKEKMPVLCTDHGMELIGIDPSDNPSKFIKKPVLEKYGEVNDQLIAQYYSGLAKKYGGKITQQYQFGLAIYDGATLESTLETSDNILVNEINLPILPGFPLDSVLKNTVNGEEFYLNELEKIKKSSFYSNYQRGLYHLLGLDSKQNQEFLVPENHLPVILPEDVEFHPTGRSPLIDNPEFHKSAELEFGPGTKREVDTMDTFVCSSWYFFRFADPHNSETFADKTKIKSWLPVDNYVIGAEHTVLHLLYARFFTKALFDEGLIDFDEPFLKMRHPGLLLGDDNRKMSKRWGNVINPSDVANEFGADTLRLYEMFMGPFEQGMPWNSTTVKGVRRFLDRLWKIQDFVVEIDVPEIETAIHRLIKKVGKDIESGSFNTTVAEYMKFVNLVTDNGKINPSQLQRFLIVLAPFAPFISEEIYSEISSENQKSSIHLESWPKYEDKYLLDKNVTIAVQVNGKLRGTFEIEADSSEEVVLSKAKEIASKYLEGKTLKFSKIITNKLVTLVVY